MRAITRGVAVTEGVGSGSGELTIRARGYRPYNVRLGAPPAVVHDVALERELRVPLMVRIVDETDRPVSHAAVKLTLHFESFPPVSVSLFAHGGTVTITLSPPNRP